MKIESSAFSEGELIPKQYTCDGENTNPPLSISEVPTKAISLVLIVDDIDAPEGVFDHWIVFDIPATIVVISSRAVPGAEGKNSFGETKYGGPCPHRGSHRYFFRVFALDKKLGMPSGSVRKKLEEAMAGHVLFSAELMGRYSR